MINVFHEIVYYSIINTIYDLWFPDLVISCDDHRPGPSHVSQPWHRWRCGGDGAATSVTCLNSGFDVEARVVVARDTQLRTRNGWNIYLQTNLKKCLVM